MRQERIAKRVARRRLRPEAAPLRHGTGPQPDTADAADVLSRIDAILDQVSPS